MWANYQAASAVERLPIRVQAAVHKLSGDGRCRQRHEILL
jgi:hypothetical protein